MFRHYGAADRAPLAAATRAIARRRGLVFLVAGTPRDVTRLKGDGRHAPEGTARRRWPRGVRTASAHGVAGLVAARRAGADLVFLSPVFHTRSHLGAPSLGRLRFGMLARAAGIPVAALGGMTPARFAASRALGAVAWGGIDAFGGRAPGRAPR